MLLERWLAEEDVTELAGLEALKSALEHDLQRR